MNRVGIVVLSWNGGPHTQACLESIRADPYPEKFVVLVDNNSAPAEREDLCRRYRDASDVQLWFLDANYGYARGNNEGIAVALGRGADVILIVTQDVRLMPGAVAALVAAAGERADVGIVGPAVLNGRGRGRILSVGECVHPALLCVPRTLLRYRRTRLPSYDVSGVLGCAMLLTRQCLEVAGGFDADFFAYYEEIDLCLRARAHGFRIVCAPQAVVVHDGMRGFLRDFTPLSAELKARNLLLLMRRWATLAGWVTLGPSYVLLMISSVTLYAVRGRLDIVAALLRGTTAGLRRRSGPVRAVVGVR
jgi:GT2 family glycosyltransferase